MNKTHDDIGDTQEKKAQTMLEMRMVDMTVSADDNEDRHTQNATDMQINPNFLCCILPGILCPIHATVACALYSAQKAYTHGATWVGIQHGMLRNDVLILCLLM